MEQDVRKALQSHAEAINNIQKVLDHIEAGSLKGRLGRMELVESLAVNDLMMKCRFLIEIVRRAGLLDDGKLEEIGEEVRAEFVNNPGWGLDSRQADKVYRGVVAEMRGDPAANDEDDPD